MVQPLPRVAEIRKTGLTLAIPPCLGTPHGVRATRDPPHQQQVVLINHGVVLSPFRRRQELS